jgi:hypothetical protein
MGQKSLIRFRDGIEKHIKAPPLKRVDAFPSVVTLTAAGWNRRG